MSSRQNIYQQSTQTGCHSPCVCYSGYVCILLCALRSLLCLKSVPSQRFGHIVGVRPRDLRPSSFLLNHCLLWPQPCFAFQTSLKNTHNRFFKIGNAKPASPHFGTRWTKSTLPWTETGWLQNEHDKRISDQDTAYFTDALLLWRQPTMARQ